MNVNHKPAHTAQLAKHPPAPGNLAGHSPGVRWGVGAEGCEVWKTPPAVGPCFRRNFFSCGSYLDQNRPGFLTITQSQPRLGLMAGSRGPTQIHIRGLCHSATAGPVSRRATPPPPGSNT